MSTDGSVYCWGGNATGQLGDGTTMLKAAPGLAAFGVSDAHSVALGNAFTCALGNGGALACWGANAFAQLGDGTMTERRLPVPVLPP